MKNQINQSKITLEGLATMIARGFENTATKNELAELRNDFKDLKGDVLILQNDVTDIKIRLDYLAPKFEVVDLEKRVKCLETSAGFSYSN
jgi:hypothetical protein